MSSNHAIKTWIKHFGETGCVLQQSLQGKNLPTAENIASVTDAAEEIFLVAYRRA
jgi:hypothetical protein